MSLIRQHLIDPEICIRCNTCEETCPVDAVTHNDDNYAVDADKCEYCLDCVAPCPTGAIDNWRVVAAPYSLEAQFSWDELPEVQETEEAAVADNGGQALDDEAAALIEIAHKGEGGRASSPASASKPQEYVQDRLRTRAGDIAGLLQDVNSHIFVCGLKGMEAGVAEALADICRLNGLDWTAVHAAMLRTGRFHVETY